MFFILFIPGIESGPLSFQIVSWGGGGPVAPFSSPRTFDDVCGCVIRVPAASVMRRLKRGSSREERGDRRWTARHANGAWQKIARSIDARPRELGLLTFIRSSGRRDRDGRCRTTSTDPARPGRAHGSRTTRTQ